MVAAAQPTRAGELIRWAAPAPGPIIKGTTSHMRWNKWPDRWQSALEACEAAGGKPNRLRIAKAASEKAISKVEGKLGIQLPEALRLVLAGFSSRVEMYWHLSPDRRAPGPLQDIFSGHCEWGLSDLPSMERCRKETAEGLTPFCDETYIAAWHNALVFQTVRNGDFLALDLRKPSCPVIYLSHEGAEFNGRVLGTDFVDFIDRWSLLGCPGAEYWQLEPFIGGDGLLDPEGWNAQQWRDWFRLRLPEL